MLNSLKKGDFKEFIRWALLSLLVGILAGLAAAVFLYLLDWATSLRLAESRLLYLLPFAGFFIGWLYHNYGRVISSGTDLILEEIHDPKKVLPLRMAPLVLVGTLLTHLFGGSAGREGTAVQMGASLGDQLSHFFKLKVTDRKKLLMAGMGAGFAAAIGAPWAGAVFGMEVLFVKKIRMIAALECLIASFVAYATTLFLRAPHSVYPNVNVPDASLKVFGSVIIAGIFFALSVRVFIRSTHAVEHIQKKYISYPPFRPMVGGVLLVALFYWEGTLRFTGLGIEVIQSAFQERAVFLDPLFKVFFTALTLGSSFKGGEFIPLVFVGSTLGSALTLYLPLTLSFSASLGFAAVFAGASKTPVACSLMAIELFGFEVAPYAFLVCYLSSYLSGSHSLYKTQR